MGERMRRGAVLLAAGLCTLLALSACTQPTASRPAPARTAAAGSASPSPSASSAPTLVYTGTARQNLPYFDAVNQKLIAAGGSLGGRDFVDNLVRAGFVKADMQVTPDRTSIGLAADNIQFSVLFKGNCLIGQYGNIGYASTVQPVLATGKCLIGKTRAIDW